MTLRYVAFASLHTDPLTIAARLTVPKGSGRRPAVIVLHGAEGPGAREGGYAGALNEAGFVTLEPDLRSPRDAPPSAHETLPDLFGARRFLAAREDVDAGRIAVLGCGSGAAAALLAATRDIDQAFPADGGFAAFLAVCPPCHVFNRVAGFEFAALVPAPILIATAALDDYDDSADAGPALARALPALDRAKVRTAVFYGVRHGFDAPGPERRFDDPAAHRGKGGTVTTAHDPGAATRAQALAVQFFSEMRARPDSAPRREAWR